MPGKPPALNFKFISVHDDLPLVILARIGNEDGVSIFTTLCLSSDSQTTHKVEGKRATMAER